MARLKLHLLGPPQAEVEDSPVEIQRRKVLALLVYLAVSGEAQRRDTLATLLWPESSQSQARAALTRHLSEIRKIIGQDGLIADRETVALTGEIWLDVNHFQQLVANCSEPVPNCLDPLTAAVDLYRDDFLTGFTLPDCPDFDEWQFFQMEGLREQLIASLDRLVQIHHNQNDHEAALPHARRRLALDPLHEPAHRTVMRLYALTGQQAAALRQYQLCEQTLEDEFGMPPSAETTALYERIRAGKISQDEPVSSAQVAIANRFEIDDLESDLLGSGGMGNVYRGLDTHSGETVVVKALRPNLVAGSPDLVERFVREGEALRRLNHPNIVKMVAAVEEDGQHYLVMEHVEGGSLRELLDQEGALPLDRVLEIALDLADALTRAHRLNIIHRDLKPGNVLLSQDGAPRLTDFGVAHLGQAERMTETGMVIGTIDYLSPEALNGEAIDARCDIWSFGVLLYELLAGQRPFAGDTLTALMQAITSRPVPDLAESRPDLPPALRNLISKMIQKDPQQRLASVRLVGAELEAILAGYGQGAFVTATPRLQIAAQPETPDQQPEIVHNLPVQPTPFIGRQAELAALDDLIANPEVRLITIVGPGGMGKTRLALAVAERQVTAEWFPDGIYFVSLAPISETERINPTMAEALGFQLDAGNRTPNQQILDYLRQKQMLIVMDNFEHLLEGVDIVADILQAAPRVQILVTSRERLHLYEEQVYPIQGLEFPQTILKELSESPENAAEYTAVKLFIQSARRMQPDFELVTDDLIYLTRICRLVEGMPLGIELAASWVDVLSLVDIATEIQQNLDFLETEIRNISERHRSMRAVFDASWQRLSETEREIFALLSVFRGGFTKGAAKEVTGASLRMLATMANKSLLRYSQRQDRYEIHELLRQYAEEQLVAAGRAESAGDTHSAFFADFLDQREADIKGRRQQAGLNEIKADFENIRAAWLWAVERKSYTVIGRTLESLYWYCEMRVRYQEGLDLLRLAREKLAPTDGEKPHPIWGRVMGRVFGLNEAVLEPPDEVKVRLETGLTIAQEQDDRAEMAFCLWRFGFAFLGDDDRTLALSYYEQSLTHYRTLADQFYIAQLLRDVGRSYHFLRQRDKVIEPVKQSLKLRREIGDQIGVVQSLHELGATEFSLLRFSEAETYLQEAYQIAREIGDLYGMAQNLGLLSYTILLGKGNFKTAKRMAEEGLTIAEQANDLIGQARNYMMLGLATGALEDYRLCRQVCSRSLAIPEFRFSGPTHIGLCLAACGLGEFQIAKDELRSALVSDRAPYYIIQCLTLAAIILANEGEAERAVELLELAFHQPGKPKGWLEKLPLLVQVQNELESTLSPKIFAAAQERGQSLDLIETADALLAELSQADWPNEAKRAEKKDTLNASILQPAYPSTSHQNWGEAPDVSIFYGRQAEADQLQRWLIEDKCRLVGVLGMGGIGKTALVTHLAEQVEDHFEYLVWTSLRNASPLDEVLSNWILFFSDQQVYDLPNEVDKRLSLLIDYLRQKRCLIVLDNAEAILQAGERAGHYRQGYEVYGRLLQRLGESRHQSCLLLTSREKPREFGPLEGETGPVRTLRLVSIDTEAGQSILQDRGLSGSEESWAALLDRYSGNPLALKLVAETVRELFFGDIAAFLDEEGDAYGSAIFGGVHDLLAQQFERLSGLEQELLIWLAIEREPVGVDQLNDNLVGSVTRRELLETLRALHRRSLLEQAEGSFTLQNVVMEFLTDYLIETITQEIINRQSDMVNLNRFALIKAQAKEYVRLSQTRLILQPTASRLVRTLGQAGA